MTYTKALKLFKGDEIKLRNTIQATRQQMYYFRSRLKGGTDLELSKYRNLLIDIYMAEKEGR